MSFVALSVITIEWSLLTYTLAFAPHTNSALDPYLGNMYYGAFDSSDKTPAGLSIPEHAMFVFQLAFAAVTAAVVSGGVVGRITYGAWTLFIMLWHLFVYTPLARWVFYPGGWLALRGVLDFAGGLVVETNSGVSAFVLAAWVSWEVARARRADADADAADESGDGAALLAEEGVRSPAPARGGAWSGGALNRANRAPHNVPFILIGAGLLFFGWLGFNAGSALRANHVAARAMANTAS